MILLKGGADSCKESRKMDFCKESRKSCASTGRGGGWGMVLLAAVLLCNNAQGDQNVSLAWNPPQGSTVAGYFLYCGPEAGLYTNRINIGNNTTTSVSGLREGQTYHFAVTAYNSAGIEKYSLQRYFIHHAGSAHVAWPDELQFDEHEISGGSKPLVRGPGFRGHAVLDDHWPDSRGNLQRVVSIYRPASGPIPNTLLPAGASLKTVPGKSDRDEVFLHRKVQYLAPRQFFAEFQQSVHVGVRFGLGINSQNRFRARPAQHEP